jgi:hypothetical protein
MRERGLRIYDEERELGGGAKAWDQDASTCMPKPGRHLPDSETRGATFLV